MLAKVVMTESVERDQINNAGVERTSVLVFFDVVNQMTVEHPPAVRKDPCGIGNW